MAHGATSISFLRSPVCTPSCNAFTVVEWLFSAWLDARQKVVVWPMLAPQARAGIHYQNMQRREPSSARQTADYRTRADRGPFHSSPADGNLVAHAYPCYSFPLAAR